MRHLVEQAATTAGLHYKNPVRFCISEHVHGMRKSSCGAKAAMEFNISPLINGPVVTYQKRSPKIIKNNHYRA